MRKAGLKTQQGLFFPLRLADKLGLQIQKKRGTNRSETHGGGGFTAENVCVGMCARGRGVCV